MARNYAILKKTDEFSSVFSFKKRVSGHFLVLHYNPLVGGASLQQPKIGMAVAKRVAKLAVDRNYMRRVLRELCQHHQPLPNTDVVIQPKILFKHADFAAVKSELASLFGKIAHRLQSEQTHG